MAAVMGVRMWRRPGSSRPRPAGVLWVATLRAGFVLVSSRSVKHPEIPVDLHSLQGVRYGAACREAPLPRSAPKREKSQAPSSSILLPCQRMVRFCIVSLAGPGRIDYAKGLAPGNPRWSPPRPRRRLPPAAGTSLTPGEKGAYRILEAPLAASRAAGGEWIT